MDESVGPEQLVVASCSRSSDSTARNDVFVARSRPRICIESASTNDETPSKCQICPERPVVQSPELPAMSAYARREGGPGRGPLMAEDRGARGKKGLTTNWCPK